MCVSPGIQGFLSHIDDNGDAEGNYTLLARQYDVTNEKANYTMLPIGHFGRNSSSTGALLPVFYPLPGRHIQWVGGAVPVDEPPCGYTGERCIVPVSK